MTDFSRRFYEYGFSDRARVEDEERFDECLEFDVGFYRWELDVNNFTNSYLTQWRCVLDGDTTPIANAGIDFERPIIPGSSRVALLISRGEDRYINAFCAWLAGRGHRVTDMREPYGVHIPKPAGQPPSEPPPAGAE